MISTRRDDHAWERKIEEHLPSVISVGVFSVMVAMCSGWLPGDFIGQMYISLSEVCGEMQLDLAVWSLWAWQGGWILPEAQGGTKAVAEASGIVCSESVCWQTCEEYHVSVDCLS